MKILVKNIIVPIFLLISIGTQAQSQLDQYKYLVIPKKFDDFKNENQYQTSTLIKYLFVKKGFSAVYEDNLPKDLKKNRCLGLYVDFIDDSSTFTTKGAIELKDCEDKEVFTTQQAKSKEKQFKSAYSEVIRETMKSFDGIQYAYNPKTEENVEGPVTVSFRNDIKKLEEPSQINTNKDGMVKQEATTENQSYKDATPIASNIKNGTRVQNAETAVNQSPIKVTLYAQEIANGFQLVDSAPKIRYKLQESSFPNVYIAEGEGKNGIVYTTKGKWIFEYYQDDTLLVEELKIKF